MSIQYIGVTAIKGGGPIVMMDWAALTGKGLAWGALAGAEWYKLRLGAAAYPDLLG